MPGIPFSTFDDGFMPAPSWRFNVDLPEIGQAAAQQSASAQWDGTGPRPLTIPGATRRSSTAGILAQSFQLVHKNIETDQVVFNAGPRFFPSIVSYDMLTVTFCETEGYDISKMYTKWRQLIIDEEGNFGLPKDYWKRITITPLTFEGKNAVVYDYEDCWPVRIDGMQFDGSATGHVTPAISFVVNTVVAPKAATGQ